MCSSDLYPLATDSEKAFTLKIKSGANYKNIKMITLKSSTTTIAQKHAIINEFNLDHDADIFNRFADLNSREITNEKKLEILNDFKISKADQSLYASEYGLEGFMEKIASALFLEKIETKFDDFNLDEISRGLGDFFTNSGSNTESFSKN